MMEIFKKHIFKAIAICAVVTFLCGLVYPLLMTGAANLFFADKASGSIIEVDGKRYGSALLAQEFSGEEYLRGRVMNENISSFLLDEEANVLIAAHGKGNEALYYSGPSNKTPASEI